MDIDTPAITERTCFAQYRSPYYDSMLHGGEVIDDTGYCDECETDRATYDLCSSCGDECEMRVGKVTGDGFVCHGCEGSS